MRQMLQRLRERRDQRLCAEASERIQELVDAEMPAGRRRRRIARHVESCIACGASADEIRELKDAIARIGRDPDPQVKARLSEVVDRIRQGDVTE